VASGVRWRAEVLRWAWAEVVRPRGECPPPGTKTAAAGGLGGRRAAEWGRGWALARPPVLGRAEPPGREGRGRGERVLRGGSRPAFHSLALTGWRAGGCGECGWKVDGWTGVGECRETSTRSHVREPCHSTPPSLHGTDSHTCASIPSPLSTNRVFTPALFTGRRHPHLRLHPRALSPQTGYLHPLASQAFTPASPSTCCWPLRPSAPRA
jgi:hypothetical protein